MQRLLRGWLLYAIFGVLIGLLYVRAVPVKFGAATVGVVEAPSQKHALEWWPSNLDAAAFKQAAARSPAMACALSLLTVIMAGLGVGGLAVTLRALGNGRIRDVWRFPSARLPAWTFEELGRITLLTVMIAMLLPFARLSFLFDELDGQPDTHLWLTLSMCVLDVFVIVAILAFALGKDASLRQTFGVSRGELAARLSIAFRAYLAAFPWLFLLLFLLVEGARAFGLKPPIEPIQQLIFQEHRPIILALTVILACVIGPLAEELFSRGVVYAAIRRRTSRVAAILASGAAFSALHANPVGFLPIMALGCLLAYRYERTGSLVSSVAVHIMHNTLLLSLALAFRLLMAA